VKNDQGAKSFSVTESPLPNHRLVRDRWGPRPHTRTVIQKK